MSAPNAFGDVRIAADGSIIPKQNETPVQIKPSKKQGKHPIDRQPARIMNADDDEAGPAGKDESRNGKMSATEAFVHEVLVSFSKKTNDLRTADRIGPQDLQRMARMADDMIHGNIVMDSQKHVELTVEQALVLCSLFAQRPAITEANAAIDSQRNALSRNGLDVVNEQFEAALRAYIRAHVLLAYAGMIFFEVRCGALNMNTMITLSDELASQLASIHPASSLAFICGFLSTHVADLLIRDVERAITDHSIRNEKFQRNILEHQIHLMVPKIIDAYTKATSGMERFRKAENAYAVYLKTEGAKIAAAKAEEQRRLDELNAAIQEQNKKREAEIAEAEEMRRMAKQRLRDIESDQKNVSILGALGLDVANDGDLLNAREQMRAAESALVFTSTQVPESGSVWNYGASARVRDPTAIAEPKRDDGDVAKITLPATGKYVLADHLRHEQRNDLFGSFDGEEKERPRLPRSSAARTAFLAAAAAPASAAAAAAAPAATKMIRIVRPSAGRISFTSLNEPAVNAGPATETGDQTAIGTSINATAMPSGHDSEKEDD